MTDSTPEAGVTITAEQAQALANAQTPAQYAAAAAAIPGLTAQAQQMAAAGAAPVQAPSFEDQLAAAQQKNTALEQQIAALQSNFQNALAGLQSQLQGVVASMPQKVDPVTESAAKISTALAAVPSSDAKNILTSVLHSHLVNLGLEDLAKLL